MVVLAKLRNKGYFTGTSGAYMSHAPPPARADPIPNPTSTSAISRVWPAILAALALAGCTASAKAPNVVRIGRSLAEHGLSERSLLASVEDMDPAMRALARRHDPGLREA